MKEPVFNGPKGWIPVEYPDVDAAEMANNPACITCKARHSPLEGSGECYDCAFSMRDPHPQQDEGVRLGSGVEKAWVKPSWPSNFQ